MATKQYWTINSRWGVMPTVKKSKKFESRRKAGNIFTSRPQAQALADYIKTLEVVEETTYTISTPNKDSKLIDGEGDE